MINSRKFRPRTSYGAGLYRTRLNRTGLSIMEVLFAIGVLTIGLLGVAHILPVATNNAANALRKDRAVEEVSNRVARDLAQLQSSFDNVIVAERSLLRYNGVGGQRRFTEQSTATFGAFIAGYDPALAPAPANGRPQQPQLPDAFCIDPWFLSATNTLRDDTGADPDDNRNGYDRTLFPCFDPRYDPIANSPSAALSLSTRPASRGRLWDGPRFTRVAPSFDGSTGFLSQMASEFSVREGDALSLVHPEDSSRASGLFVQRSSNGGGTGSNSMARNTVRSRYSSIVMLARSQPGSSLFNAAVVTLEDRQVVTVPGAGAGLEHQLAPHAVFDPSIKNQPPPPDDQKLYPGEQLGYVSFSDGPFVGGGGGEFVFRTNQFVLPEVSRGDWLMLMRREFTRNTVPSPPANLPLVVPGRLNFAWYRVTDVIGEPQLNTAGYYETQVAVRGPDWVFHPIQVRPFGPTVATYSPPYFGNPAQPSWGGTGVFNFDVMPNRGVDPPPNPMPPFSAQYEHQDYGTFVVLMPNVVGVKQFQVQL